MKIIRIYNVLLFLVVLKSPKPHIGLILDIVDPAEYKN